MLTFVWPWAFLLLPLPLAAYHWLPKATRQEAPLRVPFFDDAHDLAETPARGGRGRVGTILLLSLIWCCLLLAASRPQWIGAPVALPVSGRDLMLAVDISGSMAQEDMVTAGGPTPRITVVKKVANDFIDRRRGDRIGLLLFGTAPYLQTPLTFDRQTVKTLFNEAELGFAGKKTAIGDAIGLAVKRLKERPAQDRVLILLTDGANTAGNVQPLQAAKLAAATGVTIYTIGVGAEAMEVETLFGSSRVNPSADLDEESLQRIARLTKGRFFRARNPEELEQIYRLIDKLEPVPQESETFRPITALFYWPLAVAQILSMAAALGHLSRREPR
ncbi:MAG: VWA domain-containing protein [Desulfobulbaceae bacterium]|nr:VWA domain-containing protein [Desulfobulbaceae bacterium]